MTRVRPGRIDAYVTSVARLSEAAGYMGLAGVQRIARLRAQTIFNTSMPTTRTRACWCGRSSPTGPQLLEAHLRNATAAGPVESLIAHFGGGWVPLPLDDVRVDGAARRTFGGERNRRGAR